MEIRTSVRNLVEFILRSGDIDNRKSTGGVDSMQEGGRIHRMIQRRMGPNYHAEVPLKYVINAPDYDIVIEGRADGIIINEKPEGLLNETNYDDMVLIEDDVIIDEIKSTYRDVHKMKQAEPVHLAQAKCYAFIYSVQNNIQNIGVRMTYCNIETEELRYFHSEYTQSELVSWFDELIDEYRKWAQFEYEWKLEREASIKRLEFPFEYREGQKDLVTYVYRTIYHKRKLFIEAPTGVGKTIATVFPSVKAMGEGLTERIFYLTAKTITRTVAENTLTLLRKQKLSFKSVTLTARDKICFLDESDCNPISCEYAKGHYDRINTALFEALTELDNFSREEILRIALKYQVCPFELSLDLSLFSDMVICDYNYLFDPHAHLRRFFTEGVREDYTFLIDEAHNLVERGREMYSAVLTKEGFLELKKETKEYSDKITRALESCNKEMLKLKRLNAEVNVLEETDIAPLVRRLNSLSSAIDDYMDDHEESPLNKKLLPLYFDVSHFLAMHENLDDSYEIYTDFYENNTFYLKLFNVNPARNLAECMMRGRASILFSATLLPIEYHKSLLGADENDYEVYAKSIFDPSKRGLFIASDVTSKYTRRNEKEYRNIAGYIYETFKAKKGNYMAFFPSYAFMNNVVSAYEEQYGPDDLLVQGSSMKETEREEFISRFTLSEGEPVLGMCVLGGIFSEGIDLQDEALIGAIIVGTGLPMVCNERDILRKHFSEEGENGYDYAYKYPGMNKVLQAAGRVIRTVSDIGVVVLLDERFMETGYLRMFPREWSNYKIVSKDTIGESIRKFWEEKAKDN